MNKRIFIFAIILFVVSSTSLICWNVWHYVPTIKIGIPHSGYTINETQVVVFAPYGKA